WLGVAKRWRNRSGAGKGEIGYPRWRRYRSARRRVQSDGVWITPHGDGRVGGNARAVHRHPGRQIRGRLPLCRGRLIVVVRAVVGEGVVFWREGEGVAALGAVIGHLGALGTIEERVAIGPRS